MLWPMFAPARAPDELLQELSNDLMSPYCPGRTIASCPSKAARKLEDDILAQAKQGKTREEIEADLVERFGNDIVGYKPPPVVLWGTIVLGAVALMSVVALGRKWARRSRAASPGAATEAAEPGPAPTRHELDALDDALDEVDGF
jgi:cytochrome c-type biogenesis protein CcmH/NrfF